MPQGDAANTLPQRARALLEQQLQACRAFLEPRLAGAVRDSENNLFDSARKSRNNAEQEQSLAAANEIERLRDSIPARILELLAARIEHFGSPVARPAPQQHDAGLALLADQSQDENIVLDDLASRAESRATLPLFELGHRYAVLGGRPVFASREQPFAPAALCACIRAASDEVDLSQVARGALYRAIDKRILTAAAQLYDTLNAALREAGILANLRSFAPPRKSAARKARSYTPPAQEQEPETGDQDAATGEAPSSTTGGEPEGEEVYSALMQLLRLRRPQAPAPGMVPGRRHIPAQTELNDVLGRLQQEAATVQAPDGTLQPRNMQQLRRKMLQQLRSARDDGSVPDFSPEQTDSIELMGMLFDRLSEDIASHSGNYLLSELQAPLLRVAMTDQGFFTQPGHAARSWLEKVAEASARWASDTDPEDGDPALIERIHNMNRIINRDFDGDVSIFAGMAHDLQKQLDQLAHRANVAERRAVEAARGRERLEIARTRAETLVREHISIDGLPSLTRALLLHAWTDVLALTMLRHGEDSDDFRHDLKIAEALARGATVKAEPDADDASAAAEVDALQEEITQSLHQVGMEPKEADLLAREAMGLPTDDPEADEDDALTRTELALKLKQRKPIGVEQIDQISETAIAADGNEQAYTATVERIKQLAFGTWFEFDDPEFEGPVRRKMAWFSTQTGRCLFVNRRGVRTHDTSIDHLAQSMLAGNARVVVEDQRSFIDRAMARILKTLKRFNPATTTAGQPA